MHCPSRFTWVNFAKVCYKCLIASPGRSLFFLSTSLLALDSNCPSEIIYAFGKFGGILLI